MQLHFPNQFVFMVELPQFLDSTHQHQEFYFFFGKYKTGEEVKACFNSLNELDVFPSKQT